MPEGVDMNIEQGRNISPESSGEKPVSQWSFRQVQREKNLLDKRLQDPLASEEQKNEAKGRMGEVRGRLQGLIGDMHEIGALGGVQARYETLELMRQRGELDAKTLLEEQRYAAQVDDEVGIDKEDPHYGMVGWYYEARLGLLRSSLETSPEIPRASTGIPSEEIVNALGRVEQAIKTQTEREEPEVERIPLPETLEEAINTVKDRLFGTLVDAVENRISPLDDDQITRRKSIERYLERYPDDVSFKGQKEEALSEHFRDRFPEGVFLKEKLILYSEAMKNLAARTSETIKAEGSLAKLGAEKQETTLSDEIMVSFTNLEPVHWYVLTRGDKLFPEISPSPESRIDIEKAWKVWKDIGEAPKSKYLKTFFQNGKLVRREIFDLDPVIEIIKTGDRSKGEEERFVPRIIPRSERKEVGQRVIEELERRQSGKPLEERDMVITSRGNRVLTLEHFYTDDKGERIFRNVVAQEVGPGIGGIRSELLAYSLLRVGMTHDMWDRERWKINGDGGARDLMWFSYKQISRAVAERVGGGVLDTIGSYFALEDQKETVRNAARFIGEKRAQELYNILERNSEARKGNPRRAPILIAGEYTSHGTIIGDFYSSTQIYLDEGDKKRLIDVINERGWEGVPWLERGVGLESDAYEGYFGYKMAMAQIFVKTVMNTSFKVDDLASIGYWRSQRDVFARISAYCPTFLNPKKTGNPEYWNDSFRRTYCRGIFYLLSYKAQPQTGIRKRAAITHDDFRRIRMAVKDSNFLSPEQFNRLETEIGEFKFFQTFLDSRRR